MVGELGREKRVDAVNTEETIESEKREAWRGVMTEKRERGEGARKREENLLGRLVYL